MPESQNIEWKQSWRKDYMKWICGFANAQGGKIYIGITDEGEVHHLKNYRKLLEDIPLQIKNRLGIICDVNLQGEEGAHFIEIVVPPYSVPLSYEGRYYYRTGSVKTELTGKALNEFLLKKAGKTWDAILQPGAQMSDIDEQAVQQFVQDAEKSGRIPPMQDLSGQNILEKLRLVDEHGQVKRAAIALFGRAPQDFFPNLQVKIGRFGEDDADLRFQETIEGNLMYLIREVPQMLNRQFLVRHIDFEGLHRIEKGIYPVAALREMLLNALVHRDYTGTAVQLRVYDQKLTIWNEGLLPPGMEIESLTRHHASRPRNPLIADVCFKAGYIDTWGRGTLKIFQACEAAALPRPQIREIDGGLMVTVFKNRYEPEQLRKMNLNERQIKGIAYLLEYKRITNADYQTLNGCSRNTASNDLRELVEKDLLQPSEKRGAGSYYTLR